MLWRMRKSTERQVLAHLRGLAGGLLGKAGGRLNFSPPNCVEDEESKEEGEDWASPVHA